MLYYKKTLNKITLSYILLIYILMSFKDLTNRFLNNSCYLDFM